MTAVCLDGAWNDHVEARLQRFCPTIRWETMDALRPSPAKELVEWYALQVAPRSEELVSFHLRELSLEQYLPVLQSTTSGPHLVFPGYVFVRLCLHTGPRLYRVPHVRRILGYAGCPTAIPEWELGWVRAVIESHQQFEVLDHLTRGTSVIVIRGPLRGLRGVIMHVNKSRKIVVSLPLLNRSVAVTLTNEEVTPISEGATFSPMSFARVDPLRAERQTC